MDPHLPCWPHSAGVADQGRAGLALYLTRLRPDASSAVEHRPANVISQPLVVDDELANRLRELVALPSALASSRILCLPVRCGSLHCLDRVGGRAELVRG